MKKNIWALSTFYSTNAAIGNIIMIFHIIISDGWIDLQTTVLKMIQENAQERAKLDLMFQDINQNLLELCE